MTNSCRVERPTVSAVWPSLAKKSAAALALSSLLLLGCGDQHSTPPLPELGEASQALSGPFPLKISGNGRYLVGADDQPWRMQSEFAWLLGTKASPADMDTYLADRKAKGFNAFTVMNLVRGGGPYGWPDQNRNGQKPFLVANDFSQPNGAYFDYIDTLIDKSAAQGFAVLMFYTYAGYGGGNEGWYEIVAQPQNTKAVCYQFGLYLAGRWKNKGNVVLMAGGDFTMPAGETRDRMHEIHRGLRDGGCTQPGGSEWGYPDSLVTDQPGYSYGVQSDLNVNSWYGQGPNSTGRVYETADRAWANTPVLPSFMEEPMQGYGHYTIVDSSRPAIRRYQHWAVLAGSTAGTNWGLFELANQFVDGQWQVQLNDVMAQDQAKAFALYDSLPWWLMRPSGTGANYAARNLVVSSNPRDDSFISSSMTSDGSTLLAYVPPTGTSRVTLSVDLRSMSGNSRARWWNPTSGSFLDITGGAYSLPNSAAAQSFTTPGDNGTQSNDWMLVVDSKGSGGTPPTGTTLGETSLLPLDDSGNGNLMLAQAASLGQAGTLTSFSFHVLSAAGKLRLGLYDASGPGGGPGVKKAETGEMTPVVGWNTANALTPVSLAPGNYWLAYLPSDSNLHFSGVDNGNGRYIARAYGALPSTFSTAPTTVNWHWSFYASLSASPPANNTPPSVTSAAAANPNPSSGTTSQLGVSATDDGGESTLTYTWAPAGSVPGTVSFSPNGVNAAKLTTATFTKAGSYPLKVTIADALGSSTVSTLTANVNQSLTSVAVNPTSATVQKGQTFRFNASSVDQFGAALASAPSYTWSVSGGGSIDPTGLFSASSVGGPFSVVAAAGGRSGTASVSVSVASDFNLGESQILSTDDWGNANILVSQQVVLGQAATLRSFSFYVATARGKLRLGIYDSSGPNGGPGRKVAETAEANAVAGWNKLNATSSVSLAAGTYWLAYFSNHDGLHFRRGGAGVGVAKYYSLPYGTLPSVFSTTPTTFQDHWSFYVTLTP